jgi:hypothetical protein
MIAVPSTAPAPTMGDYTIEPLDLLFPLVVGAKAGANLGERILDSAGTAVDNAKGAAGRALLTTVDQYLGPSTFWANLPWILLGVGALGVGVYAVKKNRDARRSRR